MIKDNEHTTDIEQLRNQRNVLRAETSFIIKSTEDLLNSFNLDSKKDVITFAELSLLQTGIVYDVNNGVSFVLEYKDSNKLVFTTYMQEGGSFGSQSHDCFEICEVLEGNLFETERGYKVYTSGDFISYAPNEVHKPYATENSIYKVTFYNKLP